MNLHKTLSIAVLALAVTNCNTGTNAGEKALDGAFTDIIDIPETDTSTDSATTTETEATSTDGAEATDSVDTSDVIDTTLTDDDGDGYAEIDGDCDDANAGVYPDAPEGHFANNGGSKNANKIDDDCDGRVDETFCWCDVLVEVNSDGSKIHYGNSDHSTRGEPNAETDDTAHPQAHRTLSRTLFKQRTKVCSQHLAEFKASGHFDCVEVAGPAHSSGSRNGGGSGSGSGSGSGHRPDDGTESSSDTDASSETTTLTSTETATEISTDSGTDDATDTGDTEDTEVSNSGKTFVRPETPETSIDKYFFAWRGFDLDPKNKGTFGGASAYQTGGTGLIDMAKKQQSLTTTSVFSVSLKNAKTDDDKNNNADGKLDTNQFAAESDFTAVAYDSTAVAVHSYSCTIPVAQKGVKGAKLNDWELRYCTVVDPQSLPEFRSWYNGNDDSTTDSALNQRYWYAAIVRGFSVNGNNLDNDDAESFAIRAQIDNGDNVSADEPCGGSDESDHLLGKDSYLHPRIGVKFTQPDNKTSADVTVYYDIIGIDLKKMGVTEFSQISETQASTTVYGEDLQCSPKTSTVAGKGNKDNPWWIGMPVSLGTKVENAFVANSTVMFDDGDINTSTDRVRWARLNYQATLRSINDATATVSMYGKYHYINGNGSKAEEKYSITPVGSGGYLFYALDGKSIIAKPSNTAPLPNIKIGISIPSTVQITLP